MNVDDIRHQVAALKPGQAIRFSQQDLQLAAPRVPGFAFMGPASWPVPDQVLSGIIGSGSEFGYSLYHFGRYVTFWRLDKPLEGDCWSYIDPDRRDGWVKGPDDIYRRAP